MNETTQVVVVAALIGLVIWFIKQFLQNYFTTKIDITYGNLIKLQKDFDEHQEECDEIPKKVVIERLDNLCEKVDEIKQDMRDVKTDFNERNKSVDSKFHDLNLAINKAIKNS